MARIGVVALFGVLLRLWLAWVSADMAPVADMAQYHDTAIYQREHGEFGPSALRGPGYPLVLAVAYSMLGETNWAGRVANSVIGGLLVLATGLLARVLGGGERALVASAIVALYPGFLLSTLYQMPDTLYALLLVTCLLALPRPGPVAAVAVGVTIGLALITRSVGLVVIPAAGVSWGVELARRQASMRELAGRVLLAAVACAAVLAPWLSYTARVTGRPILDATSGYNALVGSNPLATGRLELQDGQWLIETYPQGAATVADAELQRLTAAARWASDNQARWARLAVLKVAYLWGLEGREHSALYSRDYFGPRAPATVAAWGAVVLLSFPLLVVAATGGALAMRGPWTPVCAATVTLVLATTAVHVLSFGESRFHLPLVPLLAATASLRWPPRDGVSPTRATGAAMVLALFIAAWTWQLPEMWKRLDTIRAPGGSLSIIDY